ncbi:hypothetical protein FRC06_000225 [Ceratobasidium sp. 370]|nr:hypothetical protein FRC06_000225 [Ceratobasidium sp. 370]
MIASQGGPRRAELRLHDVDRTVAQEDVRTYLRANLEHLNLSDDGLECLVQRSGGWFLYASSVVSYIGRDSSPPGAERLGRLLDISSQTESTIDWDMDVLYTTILEETVNQFGLEEVMLALSTALCTRELASMETIAGLLSLGIDRLVHIMLQPLLPVLHLPNGGELGMALYTSFATYLADPQRSGKFHCDTREGSALLAQSCFAVFDTATTPFNVCNLESSYLLDREVVGIDERANESISQAMWYASRHWAAHLKLAGLSDDLLTSFSNFLSRRLLLWIEVMNLKHHASEAVGLLHGMHRWLKEAECSVTIRDLVLDARLFMEEFSSEVVSESTPHIYVSALRLWPAHRPVSMHYMPLLRCAVKATGVMLGRRGEDATVVDDSVSRVGHSRSRFGSTMGDAGEDLYPSYVDTSQPTSQPLNGHTGGVNSIAYSPDGAYIASGSDDRTVRIWDAHTCQPMGQPPNGHTDNVQSVAYSPNGAYIASGSDDGTVRIWDAHTGQPVGQPLHGQRRSIESVAYSPDGAYFASGATDGTIQIWDAHTRQPVGRPRYAHSHWVRSVAYSPDGAYIASGSYDTTVRIWDAHTRRPVGQSLDGHTDPVWSVAYSPDGAYLASGSRDRTVRIWDAHTRQPVGQPLNGHTDYVNSVAYSPDSAYIASGSDDNTVRIWDAHTGHPVGNIHARARTRANRAPDPAPIDLDPEEDNLDTYEDESFAEPTQTDRVFSSRAPNLDAYTSDPDSPFIQVTELTASPSRLPTPPPTGGRPRSDSETTVIPPPTPVASGRWFGQATPHTPQVGLGLEPASWHAAQPPPLPLPPPTPSASIGAHRSRQQPPHLPVTPATTTTPVAPSMAPPTAATDEQMQNARERLDRRLDDFDGKEEKMRETEWRDRFEVLTAAYKVSDDQKLELWREKIVGGSEAHKWVKEMDRQNRIDNWPDLTTELAKRWPAPNATEEARENVNKWYKDKLDETKLGTKVALPGDREERYHIWWAKERLKLAGAITTSETEKVQSTWLLALPATLKGLLAKNMEDYATLADLCAAIVALDQERIDLQRDTRMARQELTDSVAEAIHRLARMELGQQTQPFQARPNNRPNPPAKTQQRFSEPYIAPFQAARQMAASAAPDPAALRGTASSQRVSGPTTTQPPGLASPFAPRSSLLPPGPGRGNSFDDTPHGRDAYAASLARVPAKVTPNTPYPLTPGTLRQNDRVCVRCGRGNHLSISCNGSPLPEAEIKWRGAVKMELMGRGMASGEPQTPGGRRDTFAVITEEGTEEDAIEMYELAALVEDGAGNAWGQQ